MSGRYLARKGAQAILTIIAIVVLNFILFRMMPGLARARPAAQPVPDPGEDRPGPRGVGPRQAAHPGPARRAIIGGDASRATSGYSFYFRGTPVTEVIGAALLADDHPHRPGRAHLDHRRPRRSARYAGWKRGGIADRVGSGISLILYSMPYFVIGMPLIIIFAASLRLVPDIGDARRSARRTTRSSTSSSTSRATWSCRSRPCRSA